MEDDDIEDFIAQQKSRLARERQELQQQNTDKVYQDLQNGSSTDFIEGRKRQSSSQNESTVRQNGGGQLALGQEHFHSNLRRERQMEYRQFQKEKEARSVQQRLVAKEDGMSLPIKDRGSAKVRAQNQRNQEYRAFIKEKELKERRRREERHGAYPPSREQPVTNVRTREERHGAYPPSREQPVTNLPHEKPVLTATSKNRYFDAAPAMKEAASQTPHPPPEYDDSRPPLPPRKGWGSPQPGPEYIPKRKGWGSPQPGPDYHDMLRRRKEEEARYRSYDHLDYYPARPSLRPSRSDPRLDRYPEEESRYRDSEDHERRRVRFSDLEVQGQDRTYYNDRHQYTSTGQEDPGYRDVLSVTRSRTLPDMDRSASKASPRAQSASRVKHEEGFIIGNTETNSAAHRRKELYRKELAQQIRDQKEAKQREREEELRVISQTVPEPSRNGHTSVASSKTPQPIIQPPAGQVYTPSFLNQIDKTQPQSRSSNQYATSSAMNIPANVVGNPLQSQILNLGMTDTLTRPPAVQEQIGSLGLDEAYAKSRPSMVNQPFSIAGHTSLGQPNQGDPYMYYKLRNPLEPDPNYNSHQMVPFQQNSALSSGSLPLNDGAVAGQLREGQHPLWYNNIPVLASGVSTTVESSTRNYVQESNLSPRAMKDPKSYQAQLMLQMRDKELRKLQEKEEKVKYEAKLEAEAQHYNPWGKGGGGAPMRNAQGQVFADLKQLHNLNEQALQDPDKAGQLYANTNQSVPGITDTAAPSGLARAMAERGMNPPPAVQPIGGPSVVAQASSDPNDLYKEQLRQQVEDKKRREAAEKEKIRLEEEKEERRLAEQMKRMKREFEIEQEAKKKKEEEKLKQQADMQAKLEEKRREAEERKKEAHDIKRREPADEAQDRQTFKQRQVTSPPVPALASHSNQMDRLKSPPIPMLRQKSTNNSPEESKMRRTPGEEEGNMRRTTIQEQSPSGYSKDEELPDTVRSESPPVPAVANRERDGGERDVISALSAMRKQLQSEQRRVLSQLEKHGEYDQYVYAKPQVASRRASPRVDIFEVARHKGSVAVRREPMNHQAVDDFNNLRNRGAGSQSRQKLKEQYPTEPQSNLALEAQQRALLKHQQSRLHNIKESRNEDIYLPSMDDIGRASESPAIALESSSAFIGIEGGESKLPSKALPNEIHDFMKPSPEPAGKPVDPFGSISSFDSTTVDRLVQKNLERNEALKALEPDSDSLVDADEILNQFLDKQSIDSQFLRPQSGKSEDLSLWLKPSEG